MKLGMFMMPLHPPERDRTEGYEEDLELVVRCDRLGYEEAWIGQHHTLDWEPIPSNDVFIANALPRTSNIKLGTGVTIMPLHHPANIATRLAYLDHLARGRFLVGFGQGGVPCDYELFGLDPAEVGLMTIRGMDMVLKLWESEAPFELKDEFWEIKVQNPRPDFDMGNILKPYQKPHPPIATSIIKAESRGAFTAGERGYIPISANMVTPEVLKRQWEVYCAGAAKAGRPEPDRADWRVSRSIMVADTDADAWEFARADGAYARSYEYLIKILKAGMVQEAMKLDPGMTDDDIDVPYVLSNLCIIGSVDTVVQRLREIIDVTGGFGTLLMLSQDSDNDERWWRCVELLATEVVPALSDR
ncbi:MAG: LLM class flavin-dependent oxidoreductase [Spirochaetaceae bacterium]|nr:LLM class flavin-dependent oxidoreductase [Spirochaetaceae bacterium]